MYITQKRACLMLRSEAGLSIAAAQSAVRELSKTLDGKREKVKKADVQKIIYAANAPTPPLPVDPKNRVRISPKRRERIRARALIR